ncbi:MAG: U32 family peptidase [Eubacteriales bacterium]
MRKVEILSPAGDMEKLKAAVAYGADAVYLAGKSFGLRAGSGNFDHDEMKEAVDYAHGHGVLCYITMNILAHAKDIAVLDSEIHFCHEIGADALIVSDAGIFRRIRRLYPDFEIHISTQASITNADGCLFWYEQGARRIVLARELTLSEIADIRRQIPDDLKLECFVHGAMCMSYSGRCLLSNYFTGRNANHGECAQPCRWKYSVTEEKRPDQPIPVEEDERGTYLFNSKDICMIDHIPELVQAGIDSFKIEGRIKGSFYAATTTKAYREALDAYLVSPDGYKADPFCQEILDRTVHRVFGTGFFYDMPADNAQIHLDDTYLRPAFVAGMVIGYDRENGLAIISQRNKISEGDILHVLMPAGRHEPILAEGLLDENREPIQSTPRAKMLYYLPVREELPVFTFLSRDGDKDKSK